MILSDRTLKEMLIKGDLTVTPVNLNTIQPASVDLTLGTHFAKVKENTAFIKADEPIEYEYIETDRIIIPANSFILARTQEYIKLPDNVSAFVEGRSSVGRMGISVQNAGWIDPGFKGTITLELSNEQNIPVELKAGMRICQIVFAKMDKKTFHPYSGKYQGQIKATGSKIYLDNDL